MILTSEVIAYSALQGSMVLIGGIVFYSSLKIFWQWDYNARIERQFELEKRSFLLSALIRLMVITNLFLFFFYIYIIDDLSLYIKSAMCGVGVVNGMEEGWSAIFIKIASLFIAGFWLLLDLEDRKTLDHRFVKKKYGLYLVVYVMLLVDATFSLYSLYSVEAQRLVSCCSILFSKNIVDEMSLERFGVGVWLYGVYFALILSLFIKRLRVYAYPVLALVLLVYGGFGLVYFVSPYIYELPTHTCPFCMLQGEYGYIGYLFYATLLGGGFFGLGGGFLRLIVKKDVDRYFYISAMFFTLFMAFCSYAVFGYYLKNGVWL
ncbi:MAG: hypothetical protein ACLFQJ_00440 [Campylobacterales bacterium]